MDEDTAPRDTRAVTAALYDAISGPAGRPRNWGQQERLFAPGARSYVLHREPDGTCSAEVLTLEQYRATRSPFFETNDFYEVEVGHEVVISGEFAHVMSAYESRRTPNGPAFESGVNAIMLARIGNEWRVTSIGWVGGGIAASLRSGPGGEQPA